MEHRYYVSPLHSPITEKERKICEWKTLMREIRTEGEKERQKDIQKESEHVHKNKQSQK